MTYQETAKVRLVELDEAPSREYREHLVRDYAAKDVDGMLPDGPSTSNQFLCSVRLGLLQIAHPATSENNEQKCLLAYGEPPCNL